MITDSTFFVLAERTFVGRCGNAAAAAAGAADGVDTVDFVPCSMISSDNSMACCDASAGTIASVRSPAALRSRSCRFRSCYTD